MSTREFTFDTPDFIEAVSWVTQSMDNTGSEEIEMSFHNDSIKFSYHDRNLFVESTCESGEYTGEDNLLRINAISLSRFLKVIPKKSTKVKLYEVLNANDDVTSLNAQAGNVKAQLHCKKAKNKKKPEYTTVATAFAHELFPILSRSGASANSDKENSSVLSSVDFTFNKNDEDNDTITIFGTDSYIMNLSNVNCTITDNDTYDNMVSTKHFLIPAVYSNLKSFSSSAKVEENVEIIIGTGKQRALGFSFPNGFVCLFTCMSVEPISSATRVFAATEKTITHNFTIDSKELKTGVRTILSLNPDTEVVKMSIDNEKIVISDNNEESVIKLPIEVYKKDGDADEEFSPHRLKFSSLIIAKLFNSLGDKESTINFSNEVYNAILVNFDNEHNEKTSVSKKEKDITQQNKTNIIVALYK